jgi:hypothetical protein
MKSSIPTIVKKTVLELPIVNVALAVQVAHATESAQRRTTNHDHSDDRPEPPSLVPLGFEFLGLPVNGIGDVIGFQNHRQVGGVVDVDTISATTGRATSRDFALSQSMTLSILAIHLPLSSIDCLQQLEFTLLELAILLQTIKRPASPMLSLHLIDLTLCNRDFGEQHLMNLLKRHRLRSGRLPLLRLRSSCVSTDDHFRSSVIIRHRDGDQDRIHCHYHAQHGQDDGFHHVVFLLNKVWGSIEKKHTNPHLIHHEIHHNKSDKEEWNVVPLHPGYMFSTKFSIYSRPKRYVLSTVRVLRYTV